MKGSNRSPWRLPAVITAAVLTLALAACGGDSNDGSDTDTTASGTQTVASLPECSTDAFMSPPSKEVTGTVKTILEQVPDLDAVKKLIPEFEKEYPGVKVEIEEAAYDVIRDKEIASFQSGDGNYNVLPVDTGWVPEYTSAGFIEDLGPAISCLGDEYAYDDFAPALREIGQAEGKVVGVPYYSYATGFVYRDDLWDAAPKTLDELVKGAQDLTDSEHAGIALQPMQGLPILEEWYPYLLAAGGALKDEDGNWTVDTPEAKEALDTYIELYETAAPKNSVNWGFDESTRAAASGKATALSTYALLFQSLNTDGSAAAGKFALAPFPGGRGTGGAWSWGIPTNGSDKDAAWAWISWITDKMQDKQRTIDGGAPTRNSTMDDPEVWKEAGGEDYFTSYKEIVGKAIPICAGVGCAEASQLIGENLNAAVAGTKSVEDALATAQSDAETASGQ